LDNKVNSLSGNLTSNYATITNLFSTGSTLDNKVNSLSGWSASALNLASTGSTLDSKIGSLSGTLTSNYATISNLASTGSTLDNKINSLSGWSASAANLASTGSTLDTKINNLSGYINSTDSNIVFTTGNQLINGTKTFNSGVVINVQPTGTNPALYITGTWNNASENYTGLSINIIDRGSATASRLFAIQSSGRTNFEIGKSSVRWGFNTLNSSTDYDVYVSSSKAFTARSVNSLFGWPSNMLVCWGTDVSNFNYDLSITRDGAGIFAQRNGVNPQQFRVYNTTGTNSGEFGLVGWINSGLVIGPQQTNSGILRDLTLTGNNININASGVVNILDNTNIVGNLTVSGNTTITGHLSAASKSFLIDHPTIIGKKLQYGSLEGPEHGVFVRGKTNDNIINLPDYWSALVDENSISVNLTPISAANNIYVVDYNNQRIVTNGNNGNYYFYTIYGERKDIPKLTVEF
ncbi:hypothetical protein EB118_21360, partial [bacterium]|nr:hypothetical protein [bacterium]